MKKTLICIDRDGTLIYDNKYYLGSNNNWKSKIEFLPGIINGIKLLNKIPNALIYMITNQSGVAIKDFPLLTEKRAHEVCIEVINLLKKENAKLNGYVMCPHISNLYVKKHRDKKFHKKYIRNCHCIKPNIGMIIEALKKEKLKRNEANIYAIGDRFSDVKTALNINGTGILIPFENQPGEDKKLSKIKNKDIYIAKNFLDAAKFIIKSSL